MSEYYVTACVTISLCGTVEAGSEKEALEKAEAMGMPLLCAGCTREHGLAEAEWDVGELDGSACEITVEPAHD